MIKGNPARIHFTIRRARALDAPGVVAVIDAVCAEGKWLFTERYSPTPQWEWVLHDPQAHRDHLLLVACVRGKIVGWCRVFPGHHRAGHVVDLGIGVLAGFRRQGIGETLLRKASSWAADHGYPKMTLDVFGNNRAALRLFRQNGFHKTGVRRSQFRSGDEYVDQVLMEKWLRGMK